MEPQQPQPPARPAAPPKAAEGGPGPEGGPAPPSQLLPQGLAAPPWQSQQQLAWGGPAALPAAHVGARPWSAVQGGVPQGQVPAWLHSPPAPPGMLLDPSAMLLDPGSPEEPPPPHPPSALPFLAAAAAPVAAAAPEAAAGGGDGSGSQPQQAAVAQPVFQRASTRGPCICQVGRGLTSRQGASPVGKTAATAVVWRSELMAVGHPPPRACCRLLAHRAPPLPPCAPPVASLPAGARLRL